MKYILVTLVTLSVLTGVFPAGVTAQPASPDTLVLTLDQSQSLALEKNPQLQSAEKDIHKSEAQITQARGNLLPSLNAFTNYSHNFELPIFVIDFGGVKQSFRAGSVENVTSGLQVQQPVFMGGRIYNGYKIAETSAEITKNQATITKQQTLLQVRQAFYNTLFTKELISVAEEALKNAQHNLDQVQKRKDVGSASGFDVLRAKVQVANTQPQVIAAEHRHDQSLTTLRTVIGLEKDTPIKVQGELKYKSSKFEGMTLQDLQQAAFSNRLELQNVHLQRDIMQRNVSIARAKYLPTIAATANLQFQAQKDKWAFGSRDFIRSKSGAVQLSIPLFAGGSNRAGVQQAEVDLRKVQDTEQQVKNMIAAEVESAYYSLSDAREKLDSQNETIQQAEESVRLAELMYKEGTATQLDVLNAQLALQQARSNYTQYLLQYNVARDQLEKAVNQLSN